MSSLIGSIASARLGGSGGGYSAKVRLSLQVGGQTLSVGQVGPGALYFDEPVSLPAQQAILIVEIDGDAKSREIQILGETAAPLPPSDVVRYESSTTMGMAR